MKLSDNFTLEEFCITQKRGLRNEPPPEVIANLRLLAAKLERARFILEGRPVLISSGYRSSEVNAAVGGAKNSAHLYGFAADFICPSFGSPLACGRRLDAAGLQFDQLIYEQTWLHLSIDPRMRREVLTANFTPRGVTYTTGIQEQTHG